MSSARSVTFVGDIDNESPLPHSPARARYQLRPGKKHFRVVAPQVAGPGGSSKNNKGGEEEPGAASAASKPTPLKPSPEWS